MKMQSRRTFLSKLGWTAVTLSGAAVIAGGITFIGFRTGPNNSSQLIDVQSISQFERNPLFFTGGLQAISAIKTEYGIQAHSMICTFEGCTLKPDGGRFGLLVGVCGCCGSSYGLDGSVQSGPATKPLPFYAMKLSPSGMLQVNLARNDRNDEYVSQSGAGVSNRLYFDVASKNMIEGPLRPEVIFESKD